MFNKFFNKKQQNPITQINQDAEEPLYRAEKSGNVVSIVKEGEANAQESIPMMETFSEHSDIPIYKGKIPVKHGYESNFTKQKDTCPRCGAKTQQMYSNFAYATNQKARLATAAAGFFCTACPTVIIDDDIMRMVHGAVQYGYGGVFTIESGYEKEPHLFQTMNGEKSLYIFDEDGGSLGLGQSVNKLDTDDDYNYILNKGGGYGGLGVPYFESPQKRLEVQKKKSKNKTKNKQAKQSRRANRKK